MPTSSDEVRVLIYQVWDDLQPRIPAWFSRPEVVLGMSDLVDLRAVRLQLSCENQGITSFIPHEDLLDARSPADRIEATLGEMAATLYRNIPGPLAGRAGSGYVSEPVAEWEKNSGWSVPKAGDVAVPIEVQRLAEMRARQVKEAEQRMWRAELAAEDAVVLDSVTIEEVSPDTMQLEELRQAVRDLQGQLAAGGGAKPSVAPAVPVDDLANGRVIRE